MRKALELSIISVPCLVIVSANSFEVEPPRRYQRDVHAAEVVVVGEQPYGEFLAPEGVFASGAPLRTEKQQFVDGQTALFQNVHKFLANGSAGPDNG